MKLSTIWEHTKDNTSKASEVVRQISFGGIALIWVFKTGNDPGAGLDKKLVIAGCLLMLSLALDLLQYVETGVRYRRFASVCKKKLIHDKVPNDKHGDYDFPLPSNFHVIGGFFYWGKIILTIGAYLLIVIYLTGKFFA